MMLKGGEDAVSIMLSDIKLRDTIGTGTYGKVYKAEHFGSPCAAKEFHSNLSVTVSFGAKDAILKKCQRLFHLRHPNLVQFLGIFYKASSSTVPVLVTELMDSSLSSTLNEFPNINISIKLRILLDVSLGLQYLHSPKINILHGNLSSFNILLSPHLQTKISDVGVAQLIKTDKVLVKKGIKSLYFVAPEVTDKLSATQKFELSIDVFSYGAVILHTITQQWPEPVNPTMLTNKKLTEVDRRQSYIDETTRESKDLGSLAVSCLDNSATKRLSIVSVSNTVKKLIENLSSPNCKRNAIAWQVESQKVAEKISHYEKLVAQKAVDMQKLEADNRYLHEQLTDRVGELDHRDADMKEEEIVRLRTENVSLRQQILAIQQEIIGDAAMPTEEHKHSTDRPVTDKATQTNGGQLKELNLEEPSNYPNSEVAATSSNLDNAGAAVSSPPDTAVMLLENVKLSYEFGEDGPKVVGFRNLGNTCYFGSVLQCLNQTIWLHYAVAEGERIYTFQNNNKESLVVRVSVNSGPMTRQLRELFSEINHLRYGSISPKSLLDVLSNENDRFGRGTQEDSHEALRYLISALRQEEIKAITEEIQRIFPIDNDNVEATLCVKDWISHASKGVTVLDDLISIQLSTSIICHECKSLLKMQDMHFDLSLPLPLNSEQVIGIKDIVHSRKALNSYLKDNNYPYAFSDYEVHELSCDTQLERSLAEFTNIDVLDEDNKFICQSCGKPDLAEQRVSRLVLIHHLSPVLMLQLKRFSIGNYGVVKDDGHVSFPRVLNMAPYCTNECVQKFADSNKEILYGLYAVVVHHGMSLHSGHYTAFVRQRPAKGFKVQLVESSATARTYDRKTADAGKWYKASDSFIASHYEFEDIQSCHAYLLFYELLPNV